MSTPSIVAKYRNIGIVSITTLVIGASLTGKAAAVPYDCTLEPGATGFNVVRDGLCETAGATGGAQLFGAGSIFERIIGILLFLVGAISVVMLIVGGIRYILSAGDQNAVTGAKNTIMYAVIGIVVAVVAYGIVNFILAGLLGAPA